MCCRNWFTRYFLILAMLALFSLPGAAAATYMRGGDFTLLSPDGPLSLSDLRGKVVLIFFGYTSCPDVCPVSLARINTCFSSMSVEELDRVRALFITLDPERDTLDRLEKYTGYFHPNIIGLRDDVETIRSVTDRYGVKFAKTLTPESAIGYSISHSTDIILLDPRGKMVEAIPHNSEPAYLRARIRDLLTAPK
ncbi:MAG TPA: SCO family protein [Gammaproteobacteria bacterium]|nr:SCO family protein [Gammaproteobacteria bacterium]